jgi:hypothetical protein
VLPASLPTLQVMIGASEVGSVMPLVKEGQTVKKVSSATAGWYSGEQPAVQWRCTHRSPAPCSSCNVYLLHDRCMKHSS